MAKPTSTSSLHWLLSAGLVLASLALSDKAEAQFADRQIGVGAAVHLGGDVHYDHFDGQGRGHHDHLAPSPGFHLHWDKLLGAKRKRRATLGGSLGILGRVMAWAPHDDHDHRHRHAGYSMLMDVALRGRFLVGFRDFVFYAGPAIGPTALSVLNDDWTGDTRAGAGINFSFVGFGFEWWWNRDHSLFVELGYAGHWLYHEPFDPQLAQTLTSVGINFLR